MHRREVSADSVPGAACPLRGRRFAGAVADVHLAETDRERPPVRPQADQALGNAIVIPAHPEIELAVTRRPDLMERRKEMGDLVRAFCLAGHGAESRAGTGVAVSKMPRLTYCSRIIAVGLTPINRSESVEPIDIKISYRPRHLWC